MNRQLDTFKEGEDHVKISHFTRKGHDIRGIVHVGTNDWYEYEFYKKMGIDNLLGFEPLEDAVIRFDEKYPDEDNLFNLALGKKNGASLLNIASGDGQSSTMYELTKEYKEEFPDIKFVGQTSVCVLTFNTFLSEYRSININDYNCLVVDVEGYELKVLRGMGRIIKKFDFLSIECSGTPTYIGAPMAGEIIDYLTGNGFKQDSAIEPHNDVMFIKI